MDISQGKGEKMNTEYVHGQKGRVAIWQKKKYFKEERAGKLHSDYKESKSCYNADVKKITVVGKQEMNLHGMMCAESLAERKKCYFS